MVENPFWLQMVLFILESGRLLHVKLPSNAIRRVILQYNYTQPQFQLLFAEQYT